MARKPSLMSAVNQLKTPKARPTPLGQAGYDNARENIDPHIRTGAVTTKEIIGTSVNISSGTLFVQDGKVGIGTALFVQDGKVGIGTATPDRLLTVVDTHSRFGIETDNNAGTMALVFGDQTDTDAGRIQYYGSTHAFADRMDFVTNAATQMTIGANGNIGIGTTSPNHTLDVNGEISGANLLMRSLPQDTKPASGTGATQMHIGETAIWIDTNDSNKCYICHNIGGTVCAAEMGV